MATTMKMLKGETSLDGYGARKSFYGKCGVRNVDGVLFLRSYDTQYYAAAYNGMLFSLCGKWTATSGRHLDAFATYANAEYHGKCGTGKKDYRSWNGMPYIEPEPYLVNGGERDLVEEIKEAYTNITTAPDQWLSA